MFDNFLCISCRIEQLLLSMFFRKNYKNGFIILYKYFMPPKTDDLGEKAVGFFADFLHLKILKKYSHTSNLHT